MHFNGRSVMRLDPIMLAHHRVVVNNIMYRSALTYGWLEAFRLPVFHCPSVLIGTPNSPCAPGILRRQTGGSGYIPRGHHDTPEVPRGAPGHTRGAPECPAPPPGQHPKVSPDLPGVSPGQPRSTPGVPRSYPIYLACALLAKRTPKSKVAKVVI